MCLCMWLSLHLNSGIGQPLGASTSEIKTLGSTDTEGTIDIKIEGGTLNSTNGEHPNFAAFSGCPYHSTGLSIRSRTLSVLQTQS